MSNVLTNLSTELSDTVEQAAPGIVRVEARKRLPASGIIWTEDGVIVTAHHVVQRDRKITIGLPDGGTTVAQLVGRDPTTDLAVLRTEASGLVSATRMILDDHSLKVGHLVLAIGRPGRSVQATLGIVSALTKEWRTPAGGKLDYYVQTDVVMYPGFSGGPLVHAGGQIVGLNTSALLRGVSLSVPVNTIESVVTAILAHGHIKRGYLGVSTQPVRLPVRVKEQLGQDTGLLLVAVEPDSPAEKGGLLLGDTIVGVSEGPVRQHDDLLAQLSGDRIGQKVEIKLIRGGELTAVTVEVGERP
jgi:S1-C subfamily serine protease